METVLPTQLLQGPSLCKHRILASDLQRDGRTRLRPPEWRHFAVVGPEHSCSCHTGLEGRMTFLAALAASSAASWAPPPASTGGPHCPLLERRDGGPSATRWPRGHGRQFSNAVHSWALAKWEGPWPCCGVAPAPWAAGHLRLCQGSRRGIRALGTSCSRHLPLPLTRSTGRGLSSADLPEGALPPHQPLPQCGLRDPCIGSPGWGKSP